MKLDLNCLMGFCWRGSIRFTESDEAWSKIRHLLDSWKTCCKKTDFLTPKHHKHRQIWIALHPEQINEQQFSHKQKKKQWTWRLEGIIKNPVFKKQKTSNNLHCWQPLLALGEMLVHSPPCEKGPASSLLCWFNWEQAEIYANERWHQSRMPPLHKGEEQRAKVAPLFPGKSAGQVQAQRRRARLSFKTRQCTEQIHWRGWEAWEYVLV